MNFNFADGDIRAPFIDVRAAFLPRVAFATLLLFALIRLPWTDRAIVAPLADAEARAARYVGAPDAPNVSVTSACSGADLLAVCLGVILVFPASWRDRLFGVLGAIAVVIATNTVRIGLLFATAGSPRLFDALHVWLLPLVLAVVAFAYVAWWTGAPHRRSSSGKITTVAVALVVVHFLAAPLAVGAVWTNSVGGATATTAAAILSHAGTTASADGARLITPRGAFDISSECLLTVLIPLYLAAVLTQLSGWRRLGAVAATPAIFFALAVIRVLSLALPTALAASPLWLVHGFFQLVLATVTVSCASGWRHAPRALASAVVGALSVGALFAFGTAAVTRTVAPLDMQGAGAMLPFVAGGVFAGLAAFRLRPSSITRAAAASLALLAGLALATIAFDLAGRPQSELPTLVLRAFAFALPVGLLLLARGAAVPATHVGDSGYTAFWHGVGDTFPDLGDAPSTAVYREDEIDLIRASVQSLDGARVFKTDLWDEARNTRVLQWVAAQGAIVSGIDISLPTLLDARREFGATRTAFASADVRVLPFADESFDVVYSMGTVEHFDETEAAVVELARVLRPGGRLILGVPNRHDPFLRPAMVAALHVIGLYDYGFEKSYSRRSLNRMLTRAGLDVVHEGGVLFMPGWLRMAELWLWTRCRPMVFITTPFVRLFAWLRRSMPALRRHGYLIASVGAKAPQSRSHS